jgi:hypothetical protein
MDGNYSTEEVTVSMTELLLGLLGIVIVPAVIVAVSACVVSGWIEEREERQP